MSVLFISLEDMADDVYQH